MLPGFLPQLSCPVVMIHSPGFGIPGAAQLQICHYGQCDCCDDQGIMNIYHDLDIRCHGAVRSWEEEYDESVYCLATDKVN